VTTAFVAGPDVLDGRPAENTRNKSPIRVLLYTTDFLPGAGGVQKHIALLAQGLLAAGHRPAVVTETSARGFDDRVLLFPVVRNPRLLDLWRFIGEADILHLAGPPFIALALGLLRRKAVIIEHHGYQAICPNGLLLHAPHQRACPGHFMAGAYDECLRCVATTRGWLYSIAQFLITFPRRWMCRLAALNTTVSNHVEKRLQLPRSRTVYHGIPATAGPESLVSICSAPISFGFVGRLVEEKGLMTLLDAASRLRDRKYDFRLKLIGDGPERARLERKVVESNLQDRVSFTGFLTGEELHRATANLAAVVMPSIMEETAGLAAIEQMMRGRLVIASDIGGLGEVVGEAGLKFAAGDADQLASCMQRVIDEHDLVNEVGQRARARSLELFTDTQKTETYISIYGQIIKNRGALKRALQRVLIYSADFWPVVGGVQSVAMTLARGFAAGTQIPGRIECTVVTDTPVGTASDADLPFRVVRNPSLVELVRLIRRSDLVHIAGPALRPLGVSFLLRKPIVVEHHGFQALCPNGLLFHEPTRSACPGHFLAGNHRECWKCNADSGYWHSFRLWALTFLRRWSCRFVDANIAPTRWLYQVLKLPRISVIAHGISERPASPYAPGSCPTFVFIGRLVSTKGVDILLDAAHELSDKGLRFRLVIAGEGPERGVLEQKCKQLELGQKVAFVGYLADSGVESLLRDATAVVMPSLAGEVFGLVAAENMMRGRVVIVPQGGSLAEVVGETGFTFAAGEARSLAACMEKVLRSPEKVAAMGERARHYSVEQFSAARMVEDHLALYRQALE
jgi:glycosyltransferase involved in cell wall biosynthesis